jgi:transposase
VYESYVPTKEFREKRSLIRHRISFIRNRTILENRVHSLLDKYDCKTDLTDIFGKSGMMWLKALDVSHIDRVILNTTIAAIENINLQADIISKELARYAWDSEDVKILLSMTGIDMLSAMVIATEIVDVKRFSSPWKLVSYAGLAPKLSINLFIYESCPSDEKIEDVLFMQIQILNLAQENHLGKQGLEEYQSKVLLG